MDVPLPAPRPTRPAEPFSPARRLAARVRLFIAPRTPKQIFGVDLTVGTLLELLARAGYAARGFLYVSMGVIALFAAIDLRRSAADSLGAILELADGPLGILWLGAVGAALVGFAIWRAAQVVLDADRQGTGARALASRAGQAISGLVYAALAWSVFEVLDVAEHARTANVAKGQAAEILSWPGGDLVLIGLGLFIVGCGVGNLVQSVLNDFGKRLDGKLPARRWAVWFGRAGYAARGVAFLPLGAFMIEAGLDLDAGQARDFGQALQSLQDQPFGEWVMGLTAAGLVGFGLFALIEARFRIIRIGRPAR